MVQWLRFLASTAGAGARFKIFCIWELRTQCCVEWPKDKPELNLFFFFFVSSYSDIFIYHNKFKQQGSIERKAFTIYPVQRERTIVNNLKYILPDV